MEHIPQVFWLIPIASVCALGMAWYFFRSMMKEDEGTPRMIEIAEHVRQGAMAYLKQQYKVVLLVFIILAIIFAIMAYERLGTICLPYRRFFLWFGWLFRYENCHICQCQNS